MKHAKLITRTPLLEQRPGWATTTTPISGGSTLEVKIQFVVTLVDRIITIVMQKQSAL